MGCKRILGSWHSSIFFHSRVCQWHIPCSAARHCMELCEILVCFWCIDADSRYRGTGLPRHRRPSWSVASGEIAAIVSLAAHVPNHQTLEGLAGRKHARGCEGGGRDAENRLNRLIAFMITLIWMVFSLQCLSILQKAITLVIIHVCLKVGSILLGVIRLMVIAVNLAGLSICAESVGRHAREVWFVVAASHRCWTWHGPGGPLMQRKMSEIGKSQNHNLRIALAQPEMSFVFRDTSFRSWTFWKDPCKSRLFLC